MSPRLISALPALWCEQAKYPSLAEPHEYALETLEDTLSFDASPLLNVAHFKHTWWTLFALVSPYISFTSLWRTLWETIMGHEDYDFDFGSKHVGAQLEPLEPLNSFSTLGQLGVVCLSGGVTRLTLFSDKPVDHVVPELLAIVLEKKVQRHYPTEEVRVAVTANAVTLDTYSVAGDKNSGILVAFETWEAFRGITDLDLLILPHHTDPASVTEVPIVSFDEVLH